MFILSLSSRQLHESEFDDGYVGATMLVVKSKQNEVFHIIHAQHEVVLTRSGCRRKKRCLSCLKRARFEKNDGKLI